MGKLSLYILDTETTNLSTEGDVIEVSFFRLDDGEQKTWYLKAMNEEAISEEALSVNKHKLEDITWKTEFGKQKYQLPKEALPEIENWIYNDNRSKLDRVMVGHNVEFDYKHLLALWNKNNAQDTFPFGNNTLDTKVISLFFDWIQDCNSRRYNLGGIIKRLKLAKRKAHSADTDVLMTVDLLNYMKSFFEKVIDKTPEKLELFGEIIEEDEQEEENNEQEELEEFQDEEEEF
jgi:DNA polymerase III alpha subunit (gram-positive type)